MLPCENRLISRKDFEAVNRSGALFSSGYISLKIKKNNQEKTRIGFSIGLKFSKKAVERNQAKRKMREIIRKNLGKIKKGFDLVFFIKRNSQKKISSKELENNLQEILKKAELIQLN